MKKKLILIGASTGGPSLIKELLQSITTLKCSVIIAQHMKEEVLPLFVKDLDENTPFDVVSTPLDTDFNSNKIIVCSSSVVIQKKGFMYNLKQDSKEQSFTPDINKLFNSFANYLSEFDVTVYIMTGIGCDGVEGAINLKAMGAKIYAQDEKSSPVYGMPKAALESGVVDDIKTFEEFKDYIEGI